MNMTDEMSAAIEQMRATKAEFAGKRIRVTRVLVYEADYETMLKQIGMSLPVGVKSLSDKTIEVFEAPWQIINTEEK